MSRKRKGHKVSRQWVLDGASKRLVTRLVRYWGELIETQDWRRFIPSAYGLASDLYFDLYPSRRGDREAAEKFWTKVCGRPCPEDQFVYDFVEGAFWAAVKRSFAEAISPAQTYFHKKLLTRENSGLVCWA